TDVLPQIGSLVCCPTSFVMAYWDKYWKGNFNPLIQKTLTKYGAWKYGMPNPMPVPYSPHPVLWSQIPCLDRQLNDLDMLRFDIENL
ncbi:MAG: hypothetical protein LUD47_05230, partial [Clostridia bacterium]|nr:hypothetical protein [Clostridia bacterium]